MTLTVRLDPALASALERYCADRSVSKSLVVQESLAVYLLAGQQPAAQTRTPASAPSANYSAFAEAGLLGTLEGGAASATKQVVRDRIQQRLTRPAPQTQTRQTRQRG